MTSDTGVGRSASPTVGGRRVAWPWLVPLAAVGGTIAAVLISLAAVLPAEPELLDPAGPAVRIALPVVKAVFTLAAAATVGALVLAAFVIPPTERAHRLALDLGAGSAFVWTLASAVATVLTFLNLAGSFSPELLVPALAQFLTEVELGQVWLLTTMAASALTILCFVARSPSSVLLTAALAFAALAPLALQGHAAGAGGHIAASSALWLHSAGAAAWVGGLIVLAVAYGWRSGGALADVLRRYSTVALACFVVVAVSGTISAALRLTEVSQLLLTPYGLLLLAKIALLLALGTIGAVHRTRLIARISENPASRRPFWVLVGAEVILMGSATGVATVLARTPTPGPETIATTVAERLTGSPLPPRFGPTALVATWVFDPVWLVVAGFGVAVYLVGVARLRRRRVEWPLSRTTAWLAGMVLLAYVTGGAPGAYATYLFSAHMTVNVALALPLPLLLALGAPAALCIASVQAREDGSRGIREWTLLALESWPGRIATHPAVAALLLATSLVLFSFTRLFGWSVDDPVGHQWMVAHFLIVGFLLAQSILAVDPLPSPASRPMRLVVLAVLAAFSAFFAGVFLSLPTLLLPDWYGVLADEWGVDPLADQRLAGLIVLGGGVLTALLMAVVVVARRSEGDRRDAPIRADRADLVTASEPAGEERSPRANGTS